MNDNTPRSQIARNAHALHQILEHADKIGLPSPYFADVDSGDEVVSLGMNSLEALTDWARWTETSIESEENFGATLHKVVGRALDHPIECWYAAGVVHPSQRLVVPA